MTDFSFDERIVDLYQQQRAHPAPVAAQIGAAIAAQIPDADDIPARLLEIGVGTGRIAWAAAQQGVDVVGFDLSPHMLRRVYADAPADAHTVTGSVAITQADMHAMPFAASSVGAVLTVAVLHLADDWQAVLRESARVLHSGGVFIRGSDWVAPESVVGKLRDELRMQAVRLDPSLMPPAAGIRKDDVLAELGGTHTDDIIAAEWKTHLSPAERLAQIEQRIDAESWILSDELFAQVLAHLHDYAADEWDDIHAPQPVQRRFVLLTTRGDWQHP